MGRFLNGVLVGVGIGMLVAPMTGEEMRNLLRDRFEELQNSLSDNEQPQQSLQHAATDVTRTTQDTTTAVRRRKRQDPFRGV